jgi:hypothetical protein
VHESTGGHASQIVPLQIASAGWHCESVVQALHRWMQSDPRTSLPSEHDAVSVQQSGSLAVACEHDSARLHGDPDPAANAAEQVEISGVATRTT